jgi:hypothetical protein
MQHCGVQSLAEFTAAERRAWLAYAPVLSMLPLARWSTADRTALVEMIRAKARISERDYVNAFAALPPLERDLARLLRKRDNAARSSD